MPTYRVMSGTLDQKITLEFPMSLEHVFIAALQKAKHRGTLGHLVEILQGREREGQGTFILTTTALQNAGLMERPK